MRIAFIWPTRARAIVIACAAALAAPSVASAATVSFWQMDESSGSTMHDSVGGNDGTLHNVALGQPGMSGTAYGFDGATSVVTVPTSSTLNPGSSPFWMSVHVKFTGTPSAAIGGDYDLMRKGLSATTGGFYKMELVPLDGGVHAHCSMGGSLTSQSVSGTRDLRDGEWHTVQCLKDDSSITVVVDGAKSSKSVALGSFSNNAPFAIGAKAEGGDWYEGLLDEASFGTGAPGGDAVAPSNTAAPAIGGAPVVGSQLTAGAGTWNGTQPIFFGYQWRRCNPAGANCANIDGATQSTYTPVTVDLKATLRVVVTATNTAGHASGTSAATGVVTAPVPIPPSPGPAPAPPLRPTAPAPPSSAATGPGAGKVSVAPASCVRLLPSAAVRKARLRGGGKLTLRFDAATGVVKFRASHGKARSVTVTLDGKRLRSARGGSLTTLLQAKSLARGRHVLRAIVHLRHGKTLTLTVRLTSTSC